MANFARIALLWVGVFLASYLVGAALGAIFGLVSTAASKLCRFWNDHELGPRRRGGREVDASSAPQLVSVLNELSRRAGMPSPRLYIVDDPRANAVATGRDHSHASICVTTGLLHTLTRDELAGVLSHELAHVLQRSALTKTVAATLSAAASVVPLLGPFIGLGIGLSLVLFLVAPAAALLVQLAIARASEYAADECGARLCGRPEDLASALRIALTDGPDDMANNRTAAALLTIGRQLVGSRRDNPFAAYPLTTNRIAALERQPRETGPLGGRGSSAPPCVGDEPDAGERP